MSRDLVALGAVEVSDEVGRGERDAEEVGDVVLAETAPSRSGTARAANVSSSPAGEAQIAPSQNDATRSRVGEPELVGERPRAVASGLGRLVVGAEIGVGARGPAFSQRKSGEISRSARAPVELASIHGASGSGTSAGERAARGEERRSSGRTRRRSRRTRRPMRIAERSLIETDAIARLPNAALAARRRASARAAGGRSRLRSPLERTTRRVRSSTQPTTVAGRRVDPLVADDPVDRWRGARRERGVARPGLGAGVVVGAARVGDAFARETLETIRAEVRPGRLQHVGRELVDRRSGRRAASRRVRRSRARRSTARNGASRCARDSGARRRPAVRRVAPQNAAAQVQGGARPASTPLPVQV